MAEDCYVEPIHKGAVSEEKRQRADCATLVVCVKQALEEALNINLIIPPKPQIVGALGAAIISRDGEG